MEETAAALDEGVIEQLKGCSTATLTMQLLKRGFRNQFIVGVGALNPEASRFAGVAYTLRNIPAREDLSRPEVQADPRYPQRLAIEETPAGSVLVMDCRGDQRAGMAGGILAIRLMQRGVVALVADGPMRDTPELERLAFPIFCSGAAAPASLTCHFAVDVQRPIACGGVAVFPGDALVGDGDGVVVVPGHLASEVARDGLEQERLERFIQMKVAQGRSIVGLYPANEETRAAYRQWIEDGEPEL
ncbi:MAG: ribonuclease activity regulator RraA [Rhodospirillaceae bacterium]|nr:ribonuclease activity regulator RraA [Rhodospirillaceae bacterium]